MPREYREDTRITSKTSKVYKIICSTHTKISTPATFLILSKVLWTHTTDAKVWLSRPTHACTHTTHAIHIVPQTRKINVNRQDNVFTTAELHHRHFP